MGVPVAAPDCEFEAAGAAGALVAAGAAPGGVLHAVSQAATSRRAGTARKRSSVRLTTVLETSPTESKTMVCQPRPKWSDPNHRRRPRAAWRRVAEVVPLDRRPPAQPGPPDRRRPATD